MIRRTLILVLFLKFSSLLATNYYVSNNGDDLNDGRSPNTAWRTLSKLNSQISILKNGDNVFFKTGDIFYGKLLVSNINGVTFSSYGSLSKPIITGGKKIEDWVKLSQKLYVSNLDEEVFQVLIGAKVMTNARIPVLKSRTENTKNYLKVNSASNDRTFISKDLIGHSDLVGGTAHVLSQPWRLSSRKIIAFNSSTGEVRLESDTRFPLETNDYFFINDHMNLLKEEKTWYFDSKEKKLFVYSDIEPKELTVSTIDDIGINIKNSNNITIDGLKITLFNKNGIQTEKSNFLKIINNELEYCYENGIFNYGGINTIVKNNVIRSSNFVAVKCRNENTLIESNTILNNGLLENLTSKGSQPTCGIETFANNAKILNNEIRDIGYIGIKFWGQNTLVEKNFIKDFCLAKYDGGAIYHWNENYSDIGGTGSKVIRNIVIGADFANDKWSANGIYMDDRSHDVEINSNTIYNAFFGVMLHNTRSHLVKNNNIYKTTSYPIRFFESWQGGEGQMRDNQIVSNKIFILDREITPVRVHSSYNTWDFSSYADNSYFNPLSNISVSVWSKSINGNSPYRPKRFDLNSWQLMSNQDGNSNSNDSYWNNFIVNSQGDNLISNGDFAKGTQGWSKVNSSESLESTNDRTFLKATVNSGTSGRLRSPSFSTKAGSTYLIEFDAFSSSIDEYIIQIVNVKNGQIEYGEQIISDIRKGWNHYSIPYNTIRNKEEAKVEFQIFGKGKELFISDLKVSESLIDVQDLKSKLVFNRNNSVQSYSLEGVWEDLDGKKFNGELTLGPFESKILIKSENSILNSDDILKDISVCVGTSTTLTAGNGSSYKWSTGATSQSIIVNPSKTTEYWVEVKRNNDIFRDDVIVSVFELPVAHAGDDRSIDLGESVVLTASGGESYLWSTGETSKSISVSPLETMSYHVTVTNSNGCVSDDSVRVVVSNPQSPVQRITADAGEDLIICEGESVILTASGGVDYKWSTGENTKSITVSPTATTSYSVVVSNGPDKDTDEVLVEVNLLPIADAGSNVTISKGETAILTASGEGNYLWSTGEESKIISVSPTETTSYSLLVTNSAGCKSTAEVKVNVNDSSADPANEDEIEIVTEDEIVVSNENEEEFNFSIYPNPTKGDLNIKVHTSSKKTYNIIFMDINGKILYRDVMAGQLSTFEKQLNVSRFSKGIYFMQLFDNDFTHTKKIILL